MENISMVTKKVIPVNNKITASNNKMEFELYTRVPCESVSLFAETVGLPCNETVTPLLVDDISYRLRQTVNVCYTLWRSNLYIL